MRNRGDSESAILLAGVLEPGHGPVLPFCTDQRFLEGTRCIPIVWQMGATGRQQHAAAMIHKALQDCINRAIDDCNRATLNGRKHILSKCQDRSTSGQLSQLASIIGTVAFGGTATGTVGGAGLGALSGIPGDYLDRLSEWIGDQAPLWDALAKNKEKCYDQYGPVAYPPAH